MHPDLIEIHRRGERPDGPLKIGSEHELLCMDSAGRVPGYHGPSGILAVLERLQAMTNTNPTMEGDRVIGLCGPSACVTLEPGGQLELAGSPLENLHEVADETKAFQAMVKQVGDELGLQFFAMGLRPVAPICRIPLMPKSRYDIMRVLMPKLGRRSIEMMFGTATVQTNLDYRSEADFARKFRVSAGLSPIAAALFANSPYQNGRPTGRMTERYAIWDETDTDRSGRFPWMLDQGLRYEDYDAWAAAQRMLFLYRDGRYIDAPERSFEALWSEGSLDAKDWEQHLGGLFPEIRLKKILELRSADSGCGEMVVALNAFWVGLLYDDQALAAADAMTASWQPEAWESLAQTAARDGLSGRSPLGSTVELSAAVLRIASAGLARRGLDEEKYLAPLQHLVDIGKSQAELLLERFEEDAAAARRFCANHLWEFPW